MNYNISILRTFSTLGLSLIIVAFTLAQSLQSPIQFIGEDYGKQFTPHHRLVDYFQQLNNNSDHLKLVQYGETSEGRPLYVAYISTVENLKNLDDIRQTNLYNAGVQAQKPSTMAEKSIVWLSYSVHGNEAGGSESSMNVAYELLNNPSKYKSWLENTIIIMDPALNPDGYSRYSHWVRSISGENIHPGHTDVEHMEPWPGGRVNHYLFDLNRDWAWQTQIETQQRIKLYNQWLPHIHADLHEMGYDDHYYFAPAAEPFHKAITDWQRTLQYDIGKNHAKYFDEKGWLYFTREIFDLLYPSYGDTWPTFNGSIGMTYEQAGHGMSGRSIQMSNGKNLTLQDRIDHHTTTSLSTIEVASIQQEKIINNFKTYFNESIQNPVGKYKSFVVRKSELTPEFKDLLDNNGIKYSTIGKGKSLSGFNYTTGKSESFKTQDNDIFISTKQAKSTLLQVFMEQEPVLADSVTYDITSWSIPYAYNLTCFALSSIPEIEVLENAKSTFPTLSSNFYAVVIPWSDSWQVKQFVGDLLQNDIIVKSMQKPTEFEDVSVNRGDLIVLKGDHSESRSWVNTLSLLLEKHEIDFQEIKSGFALSGSDLGGSGLGRIEKPKVLTFFGNNVNANAYGQLWHFFETRLQYPISRVDIDRFNRIDLDEFNTIILPDGYYSFKENQVKSLSEWVSNGGKLISIGGANRVLRENESFALNRANVDEVKNSESRAEQEKRDRKRKYEGAERRSIAGSIPGAIFKTAVDSTHPLCYGLNSYFTLKNSSAKYPLLGEGAFNPVRIPKNYDSYGFIGSDIKNNFSDSFVFAVERKGGGQVIYMADNPLFRAFWKSGELIFANAIFQLN